jgi:hypothetical protein
MEQNRKTQEQLKEKKKTSQKSVSVPKKSNRPKRITEEDSDFHHEHPFRQKES